MNTLYVLMRNDFSMYEEKVRSDLYEPYYYRHS